MYSEYPFHQVTQSQWSLDGQLTALSGSVNPPPTASSLIELTACSFLNVHQLALQCCIIAKLTDNLTF